jgi:hypothetical protein
MSPALKRHRHGIRAAIEGASGNSALFQLILNDTDTLTIYFISGYLTRDDSVNKIIYNHVTCRKEVIHETAGN